MRLGLSQPTIEPSWAHAVLARPVVHGQTLRAVWADSVPASWPARATSPGLGPARRLRSGGAYCLPAGGISGAMSVGGARLRWSP
eukprot:12709175-Alexandrium_andersonii.AAC.1